MSNIKSGRKSEIELKAAELFSQKGFVGASMRDLAQEVGLEPASIYSHFQSKDDILKTICFRCAHQFVKGIKEIKSKIIPDHKKLMELVDLHLEVASMDRSSSIVFSDEWKHLEDEDLSEFRKMRKKYEDSFKSILRSGMKNGDIVKADPEIMMRTIISSLRWVYFSDVISSKAKLDRVKNELKRIILMGIVSDSCFMNTNDR